MYNSILKKKQRGERKLYMENKPEVEEKVLTPKAWLLQTFRNKDDFFPPCFPANQTALHRAFHSVIMTYQGSIFFAESGVYPSFYKNFLEN